MTIRMLKAWNGLPEQLVTTLSASEEARLVGLGLASFDLDGAAENVRMAQLATDAAGNGVLAAPNGRPALTIRQTNVAIKSISGMMDVSSHAADRNTHIQTVTETHFDAVQLILFNVQTVTQTGIKAAAGVAAQAGVHLSTQSFTPDTWVDFTFSSASSVTQAAGSAARPSITMSDWMPINSVDRTDGGIFPLLHIRIYQPASNANISKLSNTSLTWLQTAADGRIYRAMYKDGSDMVATKSNFTSPADAPRFVPFAIRYRARGAVRTLMCVGDSIAAGYGASNLCDGYTNKLRQALSSTAAPVEFCNLGWAGQASVDYYKRALDILSSGIVPTWLLYHAYSPNDSAGPLTAAQINAQKSQMVEVIAAAFAAGAAPVIANGMPTNTASKNWGASDSLRVALNTALAAMPGVNVADISTPTSGSISGGQVQIAAGMTTDNIHPSDSGHAAMAISARTAFY